MYTQISFFLPVLSYWDCAGQEKLLYERISYGQKKQSDPHFPFWLDNNICFLFLIIIELNNLALFKKDVYKSWWNKY